MITSPLVARTLGEDAVFFSHPTRPTYGMTSLPQGAALARCELWESAGPVDKQMPLTDVLWVQCGQIAAQDHEGTYLCEAHMAYWHCEVCGIQTPEQFGAYHTCASCCDQ